MKHEPRYFAPATAVRNSLPALWESITFSFTLRFGLRKDLMCYKKWTLQTLHLCAKISRLATLPGGRNPSEGLCNCAFMTKSFCCARSIIHAWPIYLPAQQSPQSAPSPAVNFLISKFSHPTQEAVSSHHRSPVAVGNRVFPYHLFIILILFLTLSLSASLSCLFVSLMFLFKASKDSPRPLPPSQHPPREPQSSQNDL